MTTVRRLAAATVFVPLVVASALIVGAAPASAKDGEILSPADGEVIGSAGPVTVSAKTDWYQVRMALYVEGPSVPRQKIGSAGGNKTITGSFDPGNAPNGVFTVTLAGEITKRTYKTSTFTLSRPPEDPSGVEARLEGRTTIMVTWTKGNEPDLTTYEVTSKEAGRAGSVGAEAACAGSTCQATLPLTAKAAGRNVDVSVRALRSDGRGGTIESSRSATAFVSVPAAQPSPPSSPLSRLGDKASAQAQGRQAQGQQAQGQQAQGRQGQGETRAPRGNTSVHRSSAPRLPASVPSQAVPSRSVPSRSVLKPPERPTTDLKLPEARKSGGNRSEPEVAPREEPAPRETDLSAASAQSPASPLGGVGYWVYIALAVALLLIGGHMGAWFHRRRAAAVSGAPAGAGGPGTAQASSEGAATAAPPGGAGQQGPGRQQGPAGQRRPAVILAVSKDSPPDRVVLSNSAPQADQLLPRPYVLRGDVLEQRPRQPEPDYWTTDEEGGDPADPGRRRAP
ncbi:hypothetical protein [Sphaerimonospora thailandensis]|uniref:Fibronectin type-III domain-containing protein n=1 Tax=Sphaerimonospora thailandensis TaxID=795644 RepID=A0A8J3R6Z2_9ACTN|nr:hypothetical protein [Sphaerimonospora thailandensis]GIH70252.1 hypothetical protein Mth01_25050 [Sphaerimonospora thailandensis]